ncbi:MAG TPA: PIG-L family deacetylase [Burkholderiales bacterium]|jgi:LmbE family N-acetylglucosaminyl deacetylase
MNVLAIGAHFDDVELGCGGALAKHVAKGDKVVVYVATRSGFSNHRNSEVRSNDVAQAEGEAAMRALGVQHLLCGNFNTLEVEFVDALNIEILRIIEDHQIDLVYSHWVGDIHHDHQAVGRAALHSSRHVPRLLMYRSNWYHSPMDFRGNFYVDITETWSRKRDAILTHASEVERTGRKWVSFFENEAENAGQRIGRRYAEVFEVLKWID